MITFVPMKKANITVFFLLLLAKAAPANEIKAMIGMNASKYLFSDEVQSLNRQQKSGLTLGLGWDLTLNQNMKLEVNALYGQKGARASIAYTLNKTVSGIYENTSISFPFLFKYQLKKGVSPYGALGPEIVYILSHHLKIPESKENFNLTDNTRKIVLAFAVLLGYEWPIGQWGLFAEVRYNRWLSNFWIQPEASIKSESFTFLVGGIYYL
jgi:opacity protein-like surface antigen